MTQVDKAQADYAHATVEYRRSQEAAQRAGLEVIRARKALEEAKMATNGPKAST